MNKTGGLVRVENVSFQYGTVSVLNQVSFSISRGDFLAILGPNGSGKTTLVKIILGLLRPAGGRVLLMEEPVEEFEGWSKIGYVPQKATHIDPFFPATAREIVAMGLLSGRPLAGSKKKDAEAAILLGLERVGMADFKDRPIGDLSGGQQQRVIIARAIVNAPEMLFLDEPTAGVDSATQELFYEMLHSLNETQGITVVLVTHDIGIVNKHVNKVACLNQKLVYHGSHTDFCRSEAFKAMLARGHLVSHIH